MKRRGQRCKNLLETYQKHSLEYTPQQQKQTEGLLLSEVDEKKKKFPGVVSYLYMKHAWVMKGYWTLNIPFTKWLLIMLKLGNMKLHRWRFFFKLFITFWSIEEFSCVNQCTLSRIQALDNQCCNRNVLEYIHTIIETRMLFYPRNVIEQLAHKCFIWVPLTCISMNSKELSRNNREYGQNVQTLS